MKNEDKRNRFISKARLKHIGENLDYSQVIYVDSHTPVKIIDHDLRPDGTEYGEFWQTPSNHLKGQGHPDKRNLKISQSKRSKQDEIIERFKKAHENENLDYSEVVYVNMHTKVKIISHDIRPDGTEYGVFWQEPVVHLKGCTHPDIKQKGRHKIEETYTSTGRLKFIDDIVGLNIGFVKSQNNEFDIVDPDTNVVVKYVDFNKPESTRNIFQLTQKLSSNYKPIVIFEDEYTKTPNLVVDKLKNINKVNTNKPSIYARNTVVKQIENKDEVKGFVNNNHIQGFVGYTVAYGAYNNNELFAVMTFVNEGTTWNLNRYCTNINYRCPGIASKIFKHFINDYKPSSVKSFLDRRWCSSRDNNMYTKLGFKLDSVLKPDYKYTNGHGERKHKFGFRKQILHKKYGFPLTMTESQMTKELGYYKIWDCGLFKYVWTPDGV